MKTLLDLEGQLEGKTSQQQAEALKNAYEDAQFAPRALRQEAFAEICAFCSDHNDADILRALDSISSQEFTTAIFAEDLPWIPKMCRLISGFPLAMRKSLSFSLVCYHQDKLTSAILDRAKKYAVYAAMLAEEAALEHGNFDVLRNLDRGRKVIDDEVEYRALMGLRYLAGPIPDDIEPLLAIFPVEKYLHQIIREQNLAEMKRVALTLVKYDPFISCAHPKIFIIRIYLLGKLKAQLDAATPEWKSCDTYLKMLCIFARDIIIPNANFMVLLHWRDLLLTEPQIFLQYFTSWLSQCPLGYKISYASDLMQMIPVNLSQELAAQAKTIKDELEGLSDKTLEDAFVASEQEMRQITASDVTESSSKENEFIIARGRLIGCTRLWNTSTVFSQTNIDPRMAKKTIEMIYPSLGLLTERPEIVDIESLLKLNDMCAAAVTQIKDPQLLEKALQILLRLDARLNIPFPPHAAIVYVGTCQGGVLKLPYTEAIGAAISTAEKWGMDYSDQRVQESFTRGLNEENKQLFAFANSLGAKVEPVPMPVLRCLDPKATPDVITKVPAAFRRNFAYLLRDAIVNLQPISKVEIQKLTTLLAHPFSVPTEAYYAMVTLNLLRLLQLSLRDNWQDRVPELNEVILSLLRKIDEIMQEISEQIYKIWDFEDTTTLPITWNDLVLAKPARWLPVFVEIFQKQHALTKRYYVADYARMIMRLFTQLEREFAFEPISESILKQYVEILQVGISLTTYHWHEKSFFEIWLYATLDHYGQVLAGMNVRTSPRYLLNRTLASWQRYVVRPEATVLALSEPTETAILAVSQLMIDCIAQRICDELIGLLLAEWRFAPDDKNSQLKLHPLAKFLTAYRYCVQQSISSNHTKIDGKRSPEELRGFCEIADVPEKLILQVLPLAYHFLQRDSIKEAYQLLFLSYLRRIGDLPILQLRKRIAFLVDSLGEDILQLIEAHLQDIAKSKREKFKKILNQAEAPKKMSLPPLEAAVVVKNNAEPLNSLLARYPLRKRIPATWQQSEGSLNLLLEADLPWLVELYQGSGLALEKLEPKPHGCFAAFRVLEPSTLKDEQLKIIEEKLQQHQVEYKQQKKQRRQQQSEKEATQVEPKSEVTHKAAEADSQQATIGSAYSTGSSTGSLVAAGMYKSRGMSKPSHRNKPSSNAQKAKTTKTAPAAHPQKSKATAPAPRKEVAVETKIEPLSPISPLKPELLKTMQQHAKELIEHSEEAPVRPTARRSLAGALWASVAEPVAPPQHIEPTLDDRYLIPSLEFLFTKLLDPTLTAAAARYYWLRIVVLVSAAEPESQLVRWRLFQNTLLSDRRSRHGFVHCYFPLADAGPPSFLHSDFVTAILQLLTQKTNSVNSQLMLSFEKTIIEERSQYPLSININDYLQQLLAFLLTTPDQASAIFVANRIGEILALLQHFPSYANIDRNAAVSAFIALRNVTTHYAEQDKDYCNEDLLMTAQFAALSRHLRGLKSIFDTFTIDPKNLVDTSYCYSRENIEELLPLCVRDQSSVVFPLVDLQALVVQKNMSQQTLLFPIALPEGHYAALAVNLQSKRCLYLQTCAGEIPKTVKKFMRKFGSDMELGPCEMLVGSMSDRGPLFLAAAQNLLVKIGGARDLPGSLDPYILRINQNALSARLFQEQLVAHRKPQHLEAPQAARALRLS